MYEPGDAAAALARVGSTDTERCAAAAAATATAPLRPFVEGAAATFLVLLAGVVRRSVFKAVFAPGLEWFPVLVSDFFGTALFIRPPGSKAGGGADTDLTTAADLEANTGGVASRSRTHAFFLGVPDNCLTAVPRASCNEEGGYGLGVRGGKWVSSCG